MANGFWQSIVEQSKMSHFEKNKKNKQSQPF